MSTSVLPGIGLIVGALMAAGTWVLLDPERRRQAELASRARELIETAVWKDDVRRLRRPKCPDCGAATAPARTRNGAGTMFICERFPTCRGFVDLASTTELNALG